MVLEFVPCLRNNRTDRNSTSVVFSALVPRPTDHAVRCPSGAVLSLPRFELSWHLPCRTGALSLFRRYY